MTTINATIANAVITQMGLVAFLVPIVAFVKRHYKSVFCGRDLFVAYISVCVRLHMFHLFIYSGLC